MVSKKTTEELKLVSCTNLTLNSYVDQEHRCLVRMKDPSLIYESSPSTHQSRNNKKSDKTKIWNQQNIQLNTVAKEIQQLNPVSLTTDGHVKFDIDWQDCAIHPVKLHSWFDHESHFNLRIG